MNQKINKKIKLSAMFILSAIILLGFFIAPAQTFALTCNSVTFTGNILINDSPARVRFTYGADFNAVANGRGIETPTQTFYSNGNIEQFVSGLSENTIYYYRLEVASSYGTTVTNLSNFKTPQCAVPNAILNIPTITNQYPTVVLYADKESVPPGGAVTVRWLTTNATFCNASLGSPGWEGAKNAHSGSFFVGSLASSATYLITCGNSLGSATDSVSVNIQRKSIGATSAIGTTPSTVGTTPPVWTDSINKTVAPSAATFLGASVLETGFFPTNLFGWFFLIIILLVLIFLVRHAF